MIVLVDTSVYDFERVIKDIGDYTSQNIVETCEINLGQHAKPNVEPSRKTSGEPLDKSQENTTTEKLKVVMPAFDPNLNEILV